MQKGKHVKSIKSRSGKEITFRHLRRDDLHAMLAYINTLIEEDTFIGMCGDPITVPQEREFLEGALRDIERGNKSHIVVEHGDRFIGEAEVRRDRLRRKKHVGSIAISLLPAYRHEGIGTELMKLLIDEAQRLDLHLLELTCFENNPTALHLYEKMGFKRTGVTPGAIFYKGTYFGEVHLYLPIDK